MTIEPLDKRIDFRVSQKIDDALSAAAAAQGVSKSDLAREAVQRFLARQSIERGRSMLRPYAQAKGIYTDEDIKLLLEQ